MTDKVDTTDAAAASKNGASTVDVSSNHFKNFGKKKASARDSALSTEGVTEEAIRRLQLPKEIENFKKVALVAFPVEIAVLLVCVTRIKPHPALYVIDIIFDSFIIMLAFYFRCCSFSSTRRLKVFLALLAGSCMYDTAMLVVGFADIKKYTAALGAYYIVVLFWHAAIIPYTVKVLRLIQRDGEKIRDVLEVRRPSILDIVQGRRKSTLTADPATMAEMSNQSGNPPSASQASNNLPNTVDQRYQAPPQNIIQ